MRQKKKPQTYLLSIGTAVPSHRYPQKTIADFMVRYFGMNEEAVRKTSMIYQKSGIGFRHSVLADFSMNGHVPELFSTLVPNPLLSSRLSVFEKYALELGTKAVSDCMGSLRKSVRKKVEPTHLITVSCTGMSAPGLDIQLMKQLDLPQDIERTSINFMGCYAGFHAFKLADAICRSNSDAVVLVVMVELCSLHFQPEVDTENLVVNSLFADGAAAALFVSRKKMKELDSPALAVVGFHGEVIHEGQDLMTWNPSEKGFLMGLDALIPKTIEEHSGQLVQRALKKYKSSKKEIDHWAFHPGGRKILDALQQSIKLDEKSMVHSFRILRDFGNMSSPTVSFVLKSLWNDVLKWKKSESILAAGFGPGITMETALFQTEA